MHQKLSISISLTSIALAIILIAWFFLSGGTSGLEGAAWIIAILGAPTTFLDFILYKLNFTQGFTSSFLAIIFLYLAQYQLIAILFKKGVLNLRTKLGTFFVLVTIALIILSATIMTNIIFAKPKL